MDWAEKKKQKLEEFIVYFKCKSLEKMPHFFAFSDEVWANNAFNLIFHESGGKKHNDLFVLFNYTGSLIEIQDWPVLIWQKLQKQVIKNLTQLNKQIKYELKSRRFLFLS